MSRLRELREALGLTQGELAARAGVSRQLVGAAEAERHLPRVDAALALAEALGIEVEALFTPLKVPVDVVSGFVPADGSLVRSGRVGNRVVTAPARFGLDGWDVADGVVTQGTLTLFERKRPGLVVAGCEPGLEVLERLLREGGMSAVSVTASSAAAIEVMRSGRVQAAVVHGPEVRLSDAEDDVDRFHLARWQVGLAAPPDVGRGWWQEALSGRTPVVQREKGAAVQRAFETALGSAVGRVAGPRVGSHLEGARRAMLTGTPAITIEPAALAVGAEFHPLEEHEAQLWVKREWMGGRPVTEAMNVITGARFQRRLKGIGGYDLSGCGARAA